MKSLSHPVHQSIRQRPVARDNQFYMNTQTPQLPHFVSCNGQLIPPGEATISILSPTIYGAYGVYEGIQLWNRVIFHLADHLDRLEESAERIGLPLAGDSSTLTRWIHELLNAHREVLLPGSVDRAMIRLFAVLSDGNPGEPLTFIWLQAPRYFSAQDYQQGLGAITYLGERAIPQAKSLNTLVNTLARKRAEAAGEHEGLLVDREGNVREGSNSNLFVVQDDSLCLPPASDILEGVTLRVVLDLARQAGIPIHRIPLHLAEAPRWEEAFLTSTSRHVLPLVRLDGTPIQDGRPGPITRALHQRFETYFSEYTGAGYL
jgi:branched-chain amino acid aminotransferase